MEYVEWYIERNDRVAQSTSVAGERLGAQEGVVWPAVVVLRALEGQQRSDELGRQEFSQLLAHGWVHPLHEGAVAGRPMHCQTLLKLASDVTVQGGCPHWIKLRQLWQEKGCGLAIEPYRASSVRTNPFLSFVVFSLYGLLVTR